MMTDIFIAAVSRLSGREIRAVVKGAEIIPVQFLHQRDQLVVIVVAQFIAGAGSVAFE
jgi:hypothetical protein